MDDQTKVEAAKWQLYAAIVSRYERKYPKLWQGHSASVYLKVRKLMGIESE